MHRLSTKVHSATLGRSIVEIDGLAKRPANGFHRSTLPRMSADPSFVFFRQYLNQRLKASEWFLRFHMPQHNEVV